MGLFSKLFKRESNDEGDATDSVITLDVERRRPQLTRLEKALDTLSNTMRAEHTTDDPGWRGRVNEYSRLAGEAMQLKREPTREGVLDLVFEIRPVFNGAIPAGFENLAPLQAEVMAAAQDLQELLPGEKA